MLIPISTHSKAERTYALFSFRIEMAFLLLPIFLFFFSFFAESFRIHHTDLSRETVALIFDLLTIDIVHGFLTFYLLFALPEGRSFLRASISKRSAWVFIASLLTVALAVDGTAYYYNWPANSNLVFIIASALIVLRAQHTSGQCLGMANLYNLQGTRASSGIERQSLERLIKREKLLFRGFVVGFVIQRLALASPFFKTATAFKAVSSCLLGLLVIPIIINALRFPGGVWRNKLIYLLRLFCFPLTWLGGLTYIALEGLHGSEYYLLIQKMSRRSQSRLKRFLTFGIPVFLFILALPILMLRSPQFYNSIFGTQFEDPRMNYRPLLIAYFVFQYLHFYLDGVIFRFNDANVRTHLGPLLRDEGAAPVIEFRESNRDSESLSVAKKTVND